jgi:bifunctional UDP-N-acetylglucosamine pyrophosphorylase/glucosamine-1-phosphate N-acetyltransferase
MLQAVLLAAGRSTRTYPLTATRPKPLIPLLGRPLLEHLLLQIEGTVDEAILVVGYRADAIQNHLGSRFGSLPLRYLVQSEQRGTADALLQAAPLIEDRCLVLNGDDLYHRHDLQALTRHRTAILVTPVPDPQNRAVVTIAGDRVVDIVEKPTAAPPNSLASVGGYALEREWLNKLEEVSLSSRGELELPDFIQMLARESVVRYHRIERHWLPLTYAWDVLRATLFLLEGEERALDFGVVVPSPQELAERRDIQLGAGTVIEGPVLIGSGVTVGSLCRVRGPAVIGEGCIIGDRVELDRSVLFRGAQISNLANVSHSVLGEQVRIGPQAKLSAEPPSGQALEVELKGESVPARLDRLGLIAGDRAEVPAGSNVPPGTLLEADSSWNG